MKKYDDKILINTTSCQEPGQAEHDPTQKRMNHKKGFIGILKIISSFGLKNSFTNVFYRPSREAYREPEDLESHAVPKIFKSRDGIKLSGWLLGSRSKGNAKATVVHFHGCCHNMKFDAHQVDWLTGSGFNVFIFDYRGYGESQGFPDRHGIQQDGLAALDYVRGLPEIDATRILVLGQSLGGCICLAALSDADRRGIRGIAVDGTFGSYRALVNSKMTGTFLSYPLASLIVSDELAAINVISALSPIPLCFFHGSRDRVIPIGLGQKLFESAEQPKVFHVVEQAQHMQTFTIFGQENRPRLAEFFNSCIDGIETKTDKA
ncbi:MAG: alpha/beta hydrolase [Spirochaetaceae bacterium]|nr:MAG: alpha/beta hydrolase [Spirochaetaceae bacterium]